LLDVTNAPTAFTSQQVTRLSKYVDPSAASSVSTLPTDVPTPDSGSHNHNFKQDLPSVDRGDVSVEYREAQSPFGALAREFGVETQLVQALVQRLAGMC
jgi:hypothetical protein